MVGVLRSPQEIMLPSTPQTEVDNLSPEEATLLARLPLMSGNDTVQNEKASYLGYRSTGFTISQSCELAGVTRPQVTHWRKTDPVFARWENEELPRLQKEIGNDIVKFELLRNIRMFLLKDSQLIMKSVKEGIEKLSPREYEYLKAIRPMYKPSELLAMEKIISPEKHQTGPMNIILNWGSRVNNDNDMEIEGTAVEVPELDGPDSI